VQVARLLNAAGMSRPFGADGVSVAG